jgi:hypothetical protein
MYNIINIINLTTLLFNAAIKSLFNFLHVNASPTLSANPTMYASLSVVSGNFVLNPNALQFQTNKTSEYGKFLVPPLPQTCSGIF